MFRVLRLNVLICRVVPILAERTALVLISIQFECCHHRKLPPNIYLDFSFNLTKIAGRTPYDSIGIAVPTVPSLFIILMNWPFPSLNHQLDIPSFSSIFLAFVDGMYASISLLLSKNILSNLSLSLSFNLFFNWLWKSFCSCSLTRKMSKIHTQNVKNEPKKFTERKDWKRHI